MTYLQTGVLATLQGVPVEDRHDDLYEFIQEVHPSSSTSFFSISSSLRRFLKVSNSPLLLAHKSATSFYEEELRTTNAYPSIFSRRKAPESTNGTLSFIANSDQSTSNENPTPPLPMARPRSHKLSISFYWNRWFQRQKSQTKAPEVLVLKLKQDQCDPETQSANDVEESTLGERQEQQPIDPKPELLEPMESVRKPVATESEVHRRKWWINWKNKAPVPETIVTNETKEVQVLKLKQELDNPEPDTQSVRDCEEPSQEPLPIDRKIELLEPIDTNCLPVLTQSEVFRWKWFNRHKRQSKDKAPEEVLVLKLQEEQENLESASEFEEPHIGVSQEQQLPSDPEPESLKPQTPTKKVSFPVTTASEVNWKRWFHWRKNQVKVEAPEQKNGDEKEEILVLKPQQEQDNLEPLTQFGSDFKEPSQGAGQEQQLSSDPEPERLEAESANAKPNQPASDEVSLSIEPEPERLRPKTREKKFARNVVDDQIQSTFVPVAVESEDAVPNRIGSDATEPKDAEPHQPASDKVNLPIESEPERLRPKTPAKRTARTVSEDLILKVLKRESQNAAPHQPTSDEVNLQIDREPECGKEKGFARNVPDDQILSIFKRDHLSVTVESEDAFPNQLASDATELKNAEPNKPASHEVYFPSDAEPELWKPKTQEKRSARSVSEDQILSTYKRGHLSVAAQTEDVKPKQPKPSDEINSNL